MSDNYRKDNEVEYVEAEPIENDSQIARPAAPQFHTYYQTRSGCSPCCGPIGCAAVFLAVAYLVAQSDFFRSLILAGFLVLGFSALASYLARRQ